MNTNLSSTLEVLTVSHELLETAGMKLTNAKAPYVTHQIELERQIVELRDQVQELEAAALEDLTVAEAQDEVDELQMLYDRALREAQTTAISTWREGHTDGKKQWREGNYEVKLRTTRTPVVENWKDFLAHVERIEAQSVVKGVEVSLDKKRAVELSDTVALDGFWVNEVTKCSFKKLSLGGNTNNVY